jgi:hypothetical protein
MKSKEPLWTACCMWPYTVKEHPTAKVLYLSTLKADYSSTGLLFTPLLFGHFRKQYIFLYPKYSKACCHDLLLCIVKQSRHISACAYSALTYCAFFTKRAPYIPSSQGCVCGVCHVQHSSASAWRWQKAAICSSFSCGSRAQVI